MRKWQNNTELFEQNRTRIVEKILLVIIKIKDETNKTRIQESRISYIFDKTLVLSITCRKCSNNKEIIKDINS